MTIQETNIEARINYLLDTVEAKYDKILDKIYQDLTTEFVMEADVIKNLPSLTLSRRYKSRLALVISHFFWECYILGCQEAVRESNELFDKKVMAKFTLVNEYGEINRGLGESEALVSGSFTNFVPVTREAMIIMGNPSHWRAVKKALKESIDNMDQHFPDPQSMAKTIADQVYADSRVKTRSLLNAMSPALFNKGRMDKFNADPNIVGFEYITMSDPAVCEICSKRHGSKFLKGTFVTLYPPMHYFCRCYLRPIYADEWEGHSTVATEQLLEPQEGFGIPDPKPLMGNQNKVTILKEVTVKGNPNIERADQDAGFVKSIHKAQEAVNQAIIKAQSLDPNSQRTHDLRVMVDDIVGNLRHSSDRRGRIYVMSDGTLLMVNRAEGPMVTKAEKHGMGIASARYVGVETSLAFFQDSDEQWWAFTHVTITQPPREEIIRLFGKPDPLAWLGLKKPEEDTFIGEAFVGNKEVYKAAVVAKQKELAKTDITPEEEREIRRKIDATLRERDKINTEIKREVEDLQDQSAREASLERLKKKKDKEIEELLKKLPDGW